jgi:hypothetical protein
LKIKYILTEQDLRRSQTGLKKVLNSEKIKLRNDEYAMFLNSKQTHFKLLSADNVVLISYRNGERRLAPGFIKNLHQYWDGKKINISKAKHDELVKSLNRRKRND